jgi:hypothetical protein
MRIPHVRMEAFFEQIRSEELFILNYQGKVRQKLRKGEDLQKGEDKP